MKIKIIDRIGYAGTIKMLEELHHSVVMDTANEAIILCTHPSTITLGHRTDLGEVLIDRPTRLFQNIGLFFSPRGGGATFHYPGQEVIYPVLSLQKRGLLVDRYIEILARSAQNVLKRLNIPCEWDPKRPGLYVKNKKIASIGLYISKGVTSHGMAINISSDQGGFSLIHPCKSPGLQVTSIQEITGTIPERWQVAQAVTRELLLKIGGKNFQALELDSV